MYDLYVILTPLCNNVDKLNFISMWYKKFLGKTPCYIVHFL